MRERTLGSSGVRRVMSAVAVVALMATGLAGLLGVSGCSDPSATVSEWPPSESGRPTFYYFGSPG